MTTELLGRTITGNRGDPCLREDWKRIATTATISSKGESQRSGQSRDPVDVNGGQRHRAPTAIVFNDARRQPPVQGHNPSRIPEITPRSCYGKSPTSIGRRPSGSPPGTAGALGGRSRPDD